MTSYSKYVTRASPVQIYNPTINSVSTRNVTDFTPLVAPKPQKDITPTSIIRHYPATKEESFSDKPAQKFAKVMASAAPKDYTQVIQEESSMQFKRTLDFSTQTDNDRGYPGQPNNWEQRGQVMRASTPDVQGGQGWDWPAERKKSTDLYYSYSRGSVKGGSVKMMEPPIKINNSQRTNRIFDPVGDQNSVSQSLSKVGQQRGERLKSSSPISSTNEGRYFPNRELLVNSQYMDRETGLSPRVVSKASEPRYDHPQSGTQERWEGDYQATTPPPVKKPELKTVPSYQFAAAKKPAEEVVAEQSLPKRATIQAEMSKPEPVAPSRPGGISARFVEIQKALDAVKSQLMVRETPAKLAELENLMKEQGEELQRIRKLESDLLMIKSSVENLRASPAQVQQVNTSGYGQYYSSNDWHAVFRSAVEKDPKFDNYRPKVEVLPIIAPSTDQVQDDYNVVVRPLDEKEGQGLYGELVLRASQPRASNQRRVQAYQAPPSTDFGQEGNFSANGQISFGPGLVSRGSNLVQSKPPIKIYSQPPVQDFATAYNLRGEADNRNSLFAPSAPLTQAQPYVPQSYQPVSQGQKLDNSSQNFFNI